MRWFARRKGRGIVETLNLYISRAQCQPCGQQCRRIPSSKTVLVLPEPKVSCAGTAEHAADEAEQLLRGNLSSKISCSAACSIRGCQLASSFFYNEIERLKRAARKQTVLPSSLHEANRQPSHVISNFTGARVTQAYELQNASQASLKGLKGLGLGGVSLGGWLCLEDWFFSMGKGRLVSSAHEQGQGYALPPRIPLMNSPWTSEGLLTRQLINEHGQAYAIQAISEYRTHFVTPEDLQEIASAGLRKVVPCLFADQATGGTLPGMAAFFDEDLLTDSADEGADGAEPADFAASNPSAADDDRHSVDCAGMGAQADNDASKRWKSGAIPTAPVFDGDVEGDAELELEEVQDSRYDCEDGISVLLRDLETSFGERELFRQGGTIREYESIGRLQSESVNAFIRRFRLLERKMQESKVPAYPEAARVVKLLDGLRLEERATAQILLAAGNKYEMKGVLDALRVHYPPGMSITGVPRHRLELRKQQGRSRGRSSYAPSSSSSSATLSGSTASRSRGTGRPWKQWNTTWEDDYDAVAEGEYLDMVPENPHEDLHDDPLEDYEYEAEADNQADHPDVDADEAPEQDEGADENNTEGPSDDVQALLSAAQALTATSKRLAGLVQARGFYQAGKSNFAGSPKGSKGRGKGGKSKGKGVSGKGGGHVYPGGKFKSKTDNGKGAKVGTPLHRSRLKGSLCLGCGSPDHWIKGCPSFNVQNAQVSTAGIELDAEGNVVAECWMVSAEPEEEKIVRLPVLSPEDASSSDFAQLQDLALEYIGCSDKMNRNPLILLNYHNCQNAAFMIADTGCQRQVAGQAWRTQKALEVKPLQAIALDDSCHFSFGPGRPLRSQGRFVYPAAIGGEPLMLCVSSVAPDATHPAAYRSTAALKKIVDAARSVPHALSNMVDQLAQHDGAAARVRDIGQRWVLDQKNNMILATPKASPSAETPLNLSKETLDRLFATALHALASICAYQDSNTGGIIRPSEANVGEDEDSWHLWHGTNFDHNLEGSEPDELFDPNNHIPDVDTYGKESLQGTWLAEMKVYELHTRRARSMRMYGVDVVEVYGGHAGIAEAALLRGLRLLQPVDSIYDLKLHGPQDYDTFRGLLLRHRPFLTIYDMRSHVRRGPASSMSTTRVQTELQQLRRQQHGAIEAMVKTILALHREGCHFLIENPAGTPFWDHPALRRLHSVPGVTLQTGHMCRFGLKDNNGLLLKKPTSLVSDLPEVLGSAVVDGLEKSLAAHGDERFCSNYAQEAEERLRGKAALSAIVKAATPLFEKIRTLVGADASANQQSGPAIFFYGTAPDSSLDDTENLHKRVPAASRAKQTEELDAADALQPYQAGYRDITFPGLDRETPKWLLQALRRIHTNLGLGHPPKVDTATSYQALAYIANRTESEVLKVLLVNGWFSFFGYPDQLLLDAEGAFKGYRFESLQAIRYVVRALVSQFAPTSTPEMNLAMAMAQYIRFEYDSTLRAGTLEGYRQGVVVAIDVPNGNLWVRTQRKRLVLCSREQCRVVPPHAEEEWWQPGQQDLDLLKNFEEDLPRHLLAFRADVGVCGAAPAAEPEPADVPLVARGQPILERTPPLMLEPLMLVPPTPRTIHKIVAGHSWWWSWCSSAVGVALSDLPPVPEQSSATSAQGESVSRQVTSEHRSSGGLTSELERLMVSEYPDHRGTKRQASSTPEEVQLQDALLRSMCPPFSDAALRDDELQVGGDGQERQAFDAILPPGLNKYPLDDLAPPVETPPPLQAQTLKGDVRDLSPTRRLDVLRRHARGSHFQGGWDGTPRELQPIFERHSFLTAAHVCGSHEDRLGVTEGLGDDHVSCFATTSTTSTSERLAAQLLKHKVREVDPLHTSYLKYHGLSGPTTSVSISRNVSALPHRDCHNAKSSMNYHLTFGEYVGGRLWVQADGSEAVGPDGVVWRKMNGKPVAGYYHDAHQQILEFSPPDLHETEKFAGDRWFEETSGDEGDDRGHVHEATCAKKQALKKELPWKAMTPEERPSFVAAVTSQ
ncbi:unnamed protein product [Symbiodinium sp. KB8]|nr:unnamed protein product [Symbiodinium sp. KB8]